MSTLEEPKKRRHRRQSVTTDKDAHLVDDEAPSAESQAAAAPSSESAKAAPSLEALKTSPARRGKHSSMPPPAGSAAAAGAGTPSPSELQKELERERALRRAAEAESASLRDALKSELAAANALLHTSHAALVAALNARSEAMAAQLARIATLVHGGAGGGGGAAVPSTPPRSSLASSSSSSPAVRLSASMSMPVLPLTPDGGGGGGGVVVSATARGSLSHLGSLSPEVKGLINELELLDSELERRRSVGGLRLVEPPPIASLAPNALADDVDGDADGAGSSSASHHAAGGVPGGAAGGSGGGHGGRRAIVASMLALEEDYLDSIGAIVKGYWEPLLAVAEANPSVVSKQDISDMFLTLKQIYDSHRQLKLQLADRVRDWQNDSEVGDILCELPELFEPYNEYIVGSDAAHELLSRRSDDRAFAVLIERLRGERRELRGRSLGELLRLPLKRVEQYVPQLVNLVAATNESHADYANTVRALNYMRAFNAEVQTAARQRDKMLEIKSLVSDFQGLVLPNRVFLREGALVDVTDAKSGKGKQLHVFLFNDLLIACLPQKNKPLILKSRAQSHKPYKFHFKIDIDSTTAIVEEIAATPEAAAAAAAASLSNEGPTNLILKAFDRTVILQAQNGAERAAWAIAIQDALDKASSSTRSQRSRTVAGEGGRRNVNGSTGSGSGSNTSSSLMNASARPQLNTDSASPGVHQAAAATVRRVSNAYAIETRERNGSV